MDINELWSIDLGDKSLAAVPDKGMAIFENHNPNTFYILENISAIEDYFNAGVLVMKLKRLSTPSPWVTLITDAINFLIAHPESRFFDQDYLNYIFAKDYLKIDEKFNVLIDCERWSDNHQIRNAIYHYTGKSIEFDMNDVFNRLWMNYFIRTPFFGLNSIHNMYSGLEQKENEWKSAVINISALMSGKTRAFCTNYTIMSKWLKKFFMCSQRKKLL